MHINIECDGALLLYSAEHSGISRLKSHGLELDLISWLLATKNRNNRNNGWRNVQFSDPALPVMSILARDHMQTKFASD